VNEEKEREIEALSAELQNLSNKLMGSEFEVSRLKDMASYSNQDYLKKIRILEGQVEETVENGKQREAERELLHRAQLKEVKGKMAKYETEIEDKLNRIEELNEGVLMLQREVEEITDELTKARTQLGEEGEYYTIEINKLRNQMR
jgi:chromosome segregation ATPase